MTPTEAESIPPAYLLTDLERKLLNKLQELIRMPPLSEWQKKYGGKYPLKRKGSK